MPTTPYAWLLKEIKDMKVGELKTLSYNWPGLGDDEVNATQAFLDTLRIKKFTASKKNYDRNHWLSLGITRTAQETLHMLDINRQKCIGLFGTCGRSKWREPFIKAYTAAGIQFFNPVVPDWNPNCAEIEKVHLYHDQIVLFPVTRETYSSGSLAEMGFSIAQAMRFDDRRDFVFFIENCLEKDLMASNPDQAKDSLRMRALVLAHLSMIPLPNVYFAPNLSTMLNISLTLYQALEIKWELQRF